MLERGVQPVAPDPRVQTDSLDPEDREDLRVSGESAEAQENPVDPDPTVTRAPEAPPASQDPRDNQARADSQERLAHLDKEAGLETRVNVEPRVNQVGRIQSSGANLFLFSCVSSPGRFTSNCRVGRGEGIDSTRRYIC